MEKIKCWLKDTYEYCDFCEDDGYLEVIADEIHYLIVEPHSGINNKWMLRVTTKSAFDRWANSTAIEEFFETDIKLYNYLSNHQLDIYKRLLEYLSLEYEELNNHK